MYHRRSNRLDTFYDCRGDTPIHEGSLLATAISYATHIAVRWYSDTWRFPGRYGRTVASMSFTPTAPGRFSWQMRTLSTGPAAVIPEVIASTGGNTVLLGWARRRVWWSISVMPRHIDHVCIVQMWPGMTFYRERGMPGWTFGDDFPERTSRLALI